MQVANSLRDDFFKIDLEKHGALMSHKIATEAPKHVNDKKWIVRQAFGLKKQMAEMEGDKYSFQGRADLLINKTLKSIPVEHRKDYNELVLHITESITEC